MQQVIKCFLSFFYIGYFPKAPGTAGSLFTIPLIYFFFYFNFSYPFIIIFTIALILLSITAAEYIQTKHHLHDPQWIVIDEVIGMLIAWLFIWPEFDFYSIGLLFLFFRFFDIIKIWPASYFDKMKHGAGTILDDVISGIYTGIVLLICQEILL